MKTPMKSPNTHRLSSLIARTTQAPGSALACSIGALLTCALLPTAAQASTATWSGATNGTWNTTATNWTGVSGTPWDSTNGLTDNAVFNLASLNATVSATVYANGLTFTTGGTLNSGTINLAGTTPFISVASSQTATINSALTGTSGLTTTGLGTLALAGGTNNVLSGPINVNAGTLAFNNGYSIKNISGPITVANGACLNINGAWNYITPTNAIYLSGTGVGSNGALNIGGNQGMGALTLLGDTRITFAGNCSVGAITGTNTITGTTTTTVMDTTMTTDTTMAMITRR